MVGPSNCSAAMRMSSLGTISPPGVFSFEAVPPSPGRISALDLFDDVVGRRTDRRTGDAATAVTTDRPFDGDFRDVVCWEEGAGDVAADTGCSNGDSNDQQDAEH